MGLSIHSRSKLALTGAGVRRPGNAGGWEGTAASDRREPEPSGWLRMRMCLPDLPTAVTLSVNASFGFSLPCLLLPGICLPCPCSSMLLAKLFGALRAGLEGL